MAEVNEESLWLSSGACNLVSSCGQGKILVLSSWPRSTNVNSVDGRPFQDAEARKLVMCSDYVQMQNRIQTFTAQCQGTTLRQDITWKRYAWICCASSVVTPST